MKAVTLKAHGLTARLIPRGAALQDLRLDGVPYPLVLGYRDTAAYESNRHHFGATIGRFANRLRGGRSCIDGQDVQMDRNTPEGHLIHGGRAGTTHLDWTCAAHSDAHARFEITLRDGHMGFPGELSICADYRLLEGPALDITLSAKTSAPTLCSLAHHSYFNLDGTASIDGHSLSVFADHYLPTDDETLPTGDILAVDATPFDLRHPTPLARRAFDHNFCLSGARRDLARAAELTGASGLRMTLWTSEPGLQVYTGDAIAPSGPAGLTSAAYAPRAGIALEPQLWPDAPHHAQFPSALLSPGETYRQQTRFDFSKSLPARSS